MERYRGRFAPTPSGPLHFGSLIAAVGSFLEARCHQGEWLLRIDDLDPPRVAAGATDDILRTLEACGLAWDGAVVYQSARQEAYHAALHRLRRSAHVYPCACSRREIADSAVNGIEGAVYGGACRSGLPPDRRARALRLDTRGAVIDMADQLQGPVCQDIEHDVGDFILYRADRVFGYHLACVVDDAEQGVTDVVRGADLLASTPRQILLQRALGLPTPHYAHLPVAIDAQGAKLSKQTLAAPLDAHAPLAALAKALRFLGHDPPPDVAAARIDDLWRWALAEWRLARVPRVASAAVPAVSAR